jgi:hypothetical protein
MQHASPPWQSALLAHASWVAQPHSAPAQPYCGVPPCCTQQIVPCCGGVPVHTRLGPQYVPAGVEPSPPPSPTEASPPEPLELLDPLELPEPLELLEPLELPELPPEPLPELPPEPLELPEPPELPELDPELPSVLASPPPLPSVELLPLQATASPTAPNAKRYFIDLVCHVRATHGSRPCHWHRSP